MKTKIQNKGKDDAKLIKLNKDVSIDDPDWLLKALGWEKYVRKR